MHAAIVSTILLSLTASILPTSLAATHPARLDSSHQHHRRSGHSGLAQDRPAPVARDGRQVFTSTFNATASAERRAKRELEFGDAGLGSVEKRMVNGIEKRAYSGMRATFFAIGLGACGSTNSEPDYIVALNSDQYGSGYPGPECYKYITITGGTKGGTAVAQITDECPTCPYGGLDMSIALFENFASQDEGVATVTWWYNDDSSTPSTTSTYVAPTTTSTTPAYTPTTSSVWTPTTTSTYQAPTTSWTPTTTSSSSVYTPPTSSYTPSTSSVWTETSIWSSSSSSVYTPPPSSSSSSSSSTSVWSSSSSSAYTSSLHALNSTTYSKTATQTAWASSVTGSTKNSTIAAGGGDASTGSTDGAEEEEEDLSTSNLALLGTLTGQIGGLIVSAAQLAA